jgi:hypothetical protein
MLIRSTLQCSFFFLTDCINVLIDFCLVCKNHNVASVFIEIDYFEDSYVKSTLSESTVSASYSVSASKYKASVALVLLFCARKFHEAYVHKQMEPVYFSQRRS